MFSRIIIAVLALFTFSISAWASQAEANAYGLGVTMGLASFQASQAQDNDSLGVFLGLTFEELKQARKFAYLVKGTVPNLDVNQLEQMLVLVTTSHPNELNALQQVLAQLTTARGSYLVTIRKVSPRASSAFELGLDMAIAEGQATAGEAARGIVRSSLVNARGPAIALSLPRYELNKIIAQIDQGAAIADIYNQVAYLRGKYQGSL
jgi:hypothetical protein